MTNLYLMSKEEIQARVEYLIDCLDPNLGEEQYEYFVRSFLECCIEYARSIVPVKVDNCIGTSTEFYMNGRNSTIIEIHDRIDQDRQSLNN